MLKRWTDKLKRHNKRVCITQITPEVQSLPSGNAALPACHRGEAKNTSVNLKRDLPLLSLSETKDHLNKK